MAPVALLSSAWVAPAVVVVIACTVIMVTLLALCACSNKDTQQQGVFSAEPAFLPPQAKPALSASAPSLSQRATQVTRQESVYELASPALDNSVTLMPLQNRNNDVDESENQPRQIRLMTTSGQSLSTRGHEAVYQAMSEHLSEQLGSDRRQAGTLKYVPIEREMVDQTMTLFVRIVIAGEHRYAEIDHREAVSTTEQLYRCEYAYDADNTDSDAPNAVRSNSKTARVDFNVTGESLYGNADVIVKSLEISASELRLGRKLGSGAFGDVLLANWTPKHADTILKVAVKQIKVDAEDEEEAIKDFAKELSTVAQLTHENIVHVLAVVSSPPMLVLEYIPGGSLYHWFKSLAAPPPVHLSLVMAQHVAQGLNYLASRHVVHRDVAARNVLIRFEDGTRFVCKLTDFGLSGVFDRMYRHSMLTTPLPIRWTAPEVRVIANVLSQGIS
jgi:tRNA A-37 threonylcarbamoyl transferase component Bud32